MDELKNLTIDADIDEIFAINNKEIAPPKEYSDVVVMGDNKSNSLFFKINRYIDGVDLLGKTFQIFYVNADNYSDIVPVDKIIENDDCIIFSWKLDSNVTHSAGKVQFIVRISSANYVWKSKPSSIDVVETLDDTINPNNYESTWAEETERRLAAIESAGAGSSSGNNDMLTSMINGYSEREQYHYNELTGRISEISSRMYSAESDIYNLKAADTSNKEHITNLETQFYDLQSKYYTLEHTADLLQEKIYELQNQANTPHSDKDYSVAYVGVADKENNYDTISDALTSLKAHSSEYDNLELVLNSGTYSEQLLVDVPNLKMRTYTGEKDVTITWYYGIGYTYYSADSATGHYSKSAATQKASRAAVKDWGGTVILTNNAENFSAENIVFENSFNKRVTELEIADGVTAEPSAYKDTSITLDRTPKDFTATSRAATERAAAMVIRSDKAEFNNCDFIGSQDTLYFGANSSDNSNRGYFKNCNIYGMTDFIFGFGNVIFQKCKLLFCGYSDNYTERAFITANKAANKGFLFDRCEVDYDTSLNSNIPDRKFYLGRTWGIGAKTIFSKTVFDRIGIFNDDFWTEMSGSVAESEYKEAKSFDGDTLIKSEDITNTRRASRYSDSFSFTCSEWFSDWTPTGFEETLENAFYDFKCNNEGAYNESIQGTTGTWNGLTIDATSGKLAPNTGANCAQMNNGTKITITTLDSCTVTVTAYSGQGNGKLTLSQNDKSITASGDVLSISAVKGEVILTAVGNTYINSIEVNYD